MNCVQDGVRRRHRPTKLPKLNINTKQLASLPPSFGSSPGNTTPTKIHEKFRVFIGGEADALDAEFIHSAGINKIISIQCKPLPLSAKLPNVQYHFIEAADSSGQDLKQHFQQGCNLLKENMPHGATLVHCQQGISRSATLCLAFLMQQLEMSFDTAFQSLKQRRQCVSPNFAFLGQLKMWESEMNSTCNNWSSLDAMMLNNKPHGIAIKIRV